MICQDAESRASFAGIVLCPKDLFGFRDDRHEEVGVKIGIDVLHDGGDTLQTRAGVDRWRRQRRARTIGRLVELHEY